MSFKYGDTTVTLSNYLSIFKDKIVDIQDEVRSAVLDDTQIGEYIDAVGEDSYKLSQLRLAIKEGMEGTYVTPYLSSSNINKLRKCSSKGFDLSVLDRYIFKEGIPPIPTQSLDLILDVILSGKDISLVDFTTVKTELLPLVCAGLKKGYPMWLCLGDTSMSVDKLEVLIKGMQLGYDIHLFADSNWSYKQLFILMRSGVEHIEKVMQYVNFNFTTSQLTEVIWGVTKGLDVSKYAVVDESGMPIYNAYQMYEIKKGLASGLDVTSYLDPSLRDTVMKERRLALEEKKKSYRGLSGSISKRTGKK